MNELGFNELQPMGEMGQQIDPFTAQQFGLPASYSPDVQDPSMQQMMQQLGQPVQPDMTGVMGPEDILGRAAPQLSETDFVTLAKQLGLVADDDNQVMLGADPMMDPSYNDQYDIMSLLGG